MKKELDFNDLEDFDIEEYYEMPIFKGLEFLRELNVIDYEQKRNLSASLTAKFFTVKTKVTNQDIVNYLKPKLRDGISIYEVMSMIDGKAFKAEKNQKNYINKQSYE